MNVIILSMLSLGASAGWFEMFAVRDSVALELRVELGLRQRGLRHGSRAAGELHGMR